MILKKMMIQFCLISKMNKCNSIEIIDKTILSEQTKFRISEIIGIESYFYQEINQRKSYVYILKLLIVRQGFNCFKCNK